VHFRHAATLEPAGHSRGRWTCIERACEKTVQCRTVQCSAVGLRGTLFVRPGTHGGPLGRTLRAMQCIPVGRWSPRGTLFVRPGTHGGTLSPCSMQCSASPWDAGRSARDTAQPNLDQILRSRKWGCGGCDAVVIWSRFGLSPARCPTKTDMTADGPWKRNGMAVGWWTASWIAFPRGYMPHHGRTGGAPTG
jgi:hypothetical protein